jgi:hypothetical protein
MKLQYKSKPLEVKSDNRYLLYRIEPSELSWWNRIFKNPWRYAFKAYNSYECRISDKGPNDCLSFFFKAREAHEFVERYDTYEKLIDFLMAELNKAKINYNKAQEIYKKERWDF